jgi:FAD/FMN-containing dehydrogenase
MTPSLESGFAPTSRRGSAPIPGDIALLRTRLEGTVSLPGEAGYELSESWNTAVQLRPRAVVSVADGEDIAHTVGFAACHGYRVAVQCTGHGAVSMGGDDVLLIHTGRLDELQIDPVARIARIGAGLTWRPVVEAAARHGLAPNIGSAIDVGVIGFLTGGGIGPLVRAFGVSSDWITAFDVVTGNGELLHVTPDHHADLFWGLRGGKSTLGIVSAVEIALVPCTQIYGGALYYNASDADQVMHRWADWTRQLPEHANTSIALIRLPDLPTVPPPLAGRLNVAVRFASTQSASVCEPLLAAMRAVATPVMDTVSQLPYKEIGAVHADPRDPGPVSQQTTLLRELPDAAVDALLALVGPDADSPQTLAEIRLLGGAYARPATHASAFSHRAAAYSLLVIGRPTTAEKACQLTEHASTVLAAMGLWSTGGMLPNFADVDDPRTAVHRYDPPTLVGLSALGDRYDPAGVFRVGQVIRGY